VTDRVLRGDAAISDALLDAVDAPLLRLLFGELSASDAHADARLVLLHLVARKCRTSALVNIDSTPVSERVRVRVCSGNSCAQSTLAFFRDAVLQRVPELAYHAARFLVDYFERTQA
jgi:hypothetical protein